MSATWPPTTPKAGHAASTTKATAPSTPHLQSPRSSPRYAHGAADVSLCLFKVVGMVHSASPRSFPRLPHGLRIDLRQCLSMFQLGFILRDPVQALM